MLQKIRVITHGGSAYVLLFLIAVPLSFFGFSWFQSDDSNKVVAEVDNIEILERELQQRLAVELRAAEARGVDLERIDIASMRDQVARILAAQKVFDQIGERLAVKISDDMVSENIVSQNSFHEGGSFSATLYETFLQNSGYSNQYFRETVRQNLTFSQVLSPYRYSEFITPRERSELVKLQRQQRTVRLLVLPFDSELEKTEVTGDEITDRYLQNPSDYLSKEQIQVDYIEFSQEDYFEDVPEEDIRFLYEESLKSDALNREISHILLETVDGRSAEQAEQQLQELRQRVQNGENFADLAREHSEDPGTAEEGGSLGVVSENDLEIFDDDNMSGIIWALAAGEVSEPIRSDYGWHLWYRSGSEIKSYEEIREDLKRQLQYERSNWQFSDTLRDVAELAFGSKTLEGLAINLGKTIQTSDFFGREGATEAPFDNQQLSSLAFSPEVVEGGISQLARVNEQTAYIVRMKEYKQVRVLSQEEAAERIRNQLAPEKAFGNLGKTADGLLAELSKDFTQATALAEQHGAQWQIIEKLTKEDTEQPEEVIQRVFTMPRPVSGGAFMDKVALNSGDIVLIVITGVTESEADIEEPANRQLTERIRSEYAASLTRFLEQDLQNVSSVRIYTDDNDDE